MKRSVVRPPGTDAIELTRVKILENTPGSSTIEASFKESDGKLVTMAYEMRMGQSFVQVIPSESSNTVRVVSQSRFAVMPDFFADDIVVDARSLPPAKAELPSDSFLLNLLGDGDADPDGGLDQPPGRSERRAVRNRAPTGRSITPTSPAARRKKSGSPS